MKKFTKITLIFAAVLASLGLGFMIAASMMGGGLSEVFRMARSGALNFGDWHFEDGVYCSPRWRAAGMEEYENTYGSGIKHIEIDADIAEVVLKTADTEELTVSMNNGYLQYYEEEIEDGVLEISYDVGKRQFKNGPDITVRIPSDWEMVSVRAEVDLGNITVENCSLTGSVHAYTKLGDVKVDSGRCDGGTLKSDMGDVTFCGVTEGDLTLITAMGDAAAELEGEEGDYNIDLEADLGNVYYNEESYEHGAKGTFKNHNGHAKAAVCLKSSLGDVELLIEK